MIKKITEIKGALIKHNVPVYTEEFKGKDAVKKETKETLKVKHNNVEYDADTISLIYMNSATARANHLFIQALVQANPNGFVDANQTITFQDLYDSIYKSTIGWKGADNIVHNVQIESLPESIEIAMNEIAKAIGIV